MTNLWITRDVNNEDVFIWSKLPIFRDGEWDRRSPVASDVSPINTPPAKILLGDEWSNDGEFCFQIEVDSITRVLNRPEVIVQKLRAMTEIRYDPSVVAEAADIIESLSTK